MTATTEEAAVITPPITITTTTTTTTITINTRGAPRLDPRIIIRIIRQGGVEVGCTTATEGAPPEGECTTITTTTIITITATITTRRGAQPAGDRVSTVKAGASAASEVTEPNAAPLNVQV